MNYIEMINERLAKTEKCQEKGVTLIDPLTTYIDDEVEIGVGSIVYPNVSIRGNTKIGSNCIIDSGSIITNCCIGDTVNIRNSTLEDVTIGSQTSVGPYAYLHHNAIIGSNSRIGDYVEIKNSTLGVGTKVAHLAYIGDATVGNNCNIGCGTIFANYDGKKKSRIVVGNDVFIGSNSNLIAPVLIADGAYIACATTVNNDLPVDCLVVGRVNAVIKEGRGIGRYRR